MVYVWFLFTVVFAGGCGEEFGKAEESRAIAVKSDIAKRVAAAVEADPLIVKIKAALAKRAAEVAASKTAAVEADPATAKIKAELAKRAAEVTAREAEKIAMVITRQSVIRATIAVVKRIRKANPNEVTSKVVTKIEAAAKRNIEGNHVCEQASVICGTWSGGIVFEAFEQTIKAIIEADPKIAKRKEAIAKEVKEKAEDAEKSVRKVIKEEMVGAALRKIVEAAGGGIKEKVLREVVKELETDVDGQKMAADAIVEAAMGNPVPVKARSAAAAEGVWKDIDSWLDSKRGTL
ncbi:hypothetical protein [Candidatus Cardinium hertigii]|nr:hypothetical protein [Candidatus Cardinium hertigii]